MPVTQQKFKDIALKLKTKFADFFISRQFTILGALDPITDAASPSIVGNVEAVRLEYDIKQKDGNSIQKNDFQLLLLNEDWVDEFPSNITPKTNGLKVLVDSFICTVISAEADPATATWILQVRG